MIIVKLEVKLTEKKRNTQAILAANDLTKLDAAVSNCNEIATDSKAMMDSLTSLICKVKAGTLKANLKDLEKSLNKNKAFMDKLGPALAECPNSNFTPWEEKPCTGGPCAFEWENRYVVDNGCLKALMAVFVINSKSQTECFEKIKDQPDLVKLVKDAIVKDCPSNIDDELGKYVSSFGKFCDSHRYALMYCLSEFPCVGKDEEMINQLLSTTPSSDIAKIREGLLKNNFLERLISGVDDQNFDNLIKILSEKFSKKKPAIADKTFIFDGDDGLPYEIENGEVTFKARKNFTIDYYQNFKIGVFDWVNIVFADDFIHNGHEYKKGEKGIIPAIELWGLFNQSDRNKNKLLASGVLDIGLTLVGIGSFKKIKDLPKVVRIIAYTKAGVDIGTGLFGFALAAGLEDELSTTEEGREFLSYWIYFNIGYGVTSLNEEAVIALYRRADKLLVVGKNLSASTKQWLKTLKEKLEALAKTKGWKLTNVRKLLDNELQVGKFGDLSIANTAGKNGLTAHHIPSDAYMKKLIERGLLSSNEYKHSEGLCILVESSADVTNKIPRHNRTKTFWTNMSKTERDTYNKLSPKEALEFDIEDLRNIFKEDGVYNSKVENSLQELIKQTKNKYKSLFD